MVPSYKRLFLLLSSYKYYISSVQVYLISISHDRNDYDLIVDKMSSANDGIDALILLLEK